MECHASLHVDTGVSAGTNIALWMLTLVVLVAGAAAVAGKAIGGWNMDPKTQYHIQTDEGDERYFRYQTISGQYRKEKRLNDGTVVGTYGWVDPNGFLRLRDYVADNNGYKVVKTKMVYVGKDSDGRNDAKSTSAFPLSVSLTSPTTLSTTPESTHSNSVHTSAAPSSPVSIQSDAFTHQLSPISFNDISQPSSTPFPIHAKPLQSPMLSTNHQNSNTFLYTSNSPYFSFAGDYQTGNSLNNGYRDLNNQEVSASIQNYQTYKLPQQQYPIYDGIATTHNGFRYYLPYHYHEEENSGSDTRAGSFGYIDPFGIRRVIYYNTAPGTGFIHKKNNRFVGFSATPYDTRF